MAEWIRVALDLILILIVGVGLAQTMRLIKHLMGLQQNRIEMERFVRDFHATVLRAEAGIKNLKSAARESGDDLEKLVEKATLVRDELNFIVESADQLAERITKSASSVARPEQVSASKASDTKLAATNEDLSSQNNPSETRGQAAPSSRAEKELLQALQKLS
jgi:SMC interacting uncharacterized protein involved in chromosome segregation